jgi:hypothetical protein
MTGASPHVSLHLAAVRRNLSTLPADTQEHLATLVLDRPPSGKFQRIGDAVMAREINLQSQSEALCDVALRLSLWALVYYSGQFVPYNMFLSRALGNRVNKGSSAVREFASKHSELRRRVAELNLRAVGYVTQRWSTDPSTVDGFRLTRDGDDYFESIHMPQMLKLTNARNRLVRDVADDRLRLDDVRTPPLRAQLAASKDFASELLRLAPK